MVKSKSSPMIKVLFGLSVVVVVVVVIYFTTRNIKTSSTITTSTTTPPSTKTSSQPSSSSIEKAVEWITTTLEPLTTTIMPTTTSGPSYVLPVIWFKFDNGDMTGSAIKNYGSITTDGTAYGNATISTTEYKVGTGSLYLDGNSSYVSVPDPVVSENGLSITAWFKISTTSGYMRVFDFGNGGPNENIIYGPFYGITVINGTSTNPMFQPGSSSGNKGDGTWHHLAITMTYAQSYSFTSTLKIYIDNSLYYNSTSAYYPRIVERTQNYIGRSHWADPYTVGYIDDFRVYDYIITQEQLTSIYNEAVR